MRFSAKSEMNYALMKKHEEDYQLVKAEYRLLVASGQSCVMTTLDLVGVCWVT